jgi:hypothetical protein
LVFNLDRKVSQVLSTQGTAAIRPFTHNPSGNKALQLPGGLQKDIPDVVSLISFASTLTSLALQSGIRFCATSGSFHKSSLILYKVYALLQPYKV